MSTSTVQIDGSQGEGGGQILRSALALSAASGRPFRISNIRARRPKPGLMRQHLTSVQAVAAICSARVTGAHTGSMELTFEPGPVCSGQYTFPIGTAGSTAMVLQAVLPPLLRADGPSRITVEGGTHAKFAPTFDFFERALAPVLAKMGHGIAARLDRHGFYPAGGGRVVVDITPAAIPAPLELHDRGNITRERASVLISQLSDAIALRELDTVREKLRWPVDPTCIVRPTPAFGPGNAVILELGFDHVTEVFSGIGEIARSAEAVARDAIDDLREYLKWGAPVGKYMADQLIVPLALGAGGSFTTTRLTGHTKTNFDVVRAFLPVEITTEGKERVVVTVRPRGRND